MVGGGGWGIVGEGFRDRVFMCVCAGRLGGAGRLEQHMTDIVITAMSCRRVTQARSSVAMCHVPLPPSPLAFHHWGVVVVVLLMVGGRFGNAGAPLSAFHAFN